MKYLRWTVIVVWIAIAAILVSFWKIFFEFFGVLFFVVFFWIHGLFAGHIN